MDDRIEIYANINIAYKKEDGYIFQFITIKPNKPGNIRYFTQSKYKVGRVVEDFLQTIFIGDGENILFDSISEFRNTQTIKYSIEDDSFYINLKEKNYLIEGDKPKFDGCAACQHLRQSRQGKDRCALYKKFLDKYKKSCVDFLEKD